MDDKKIRSQVDKFGDNLQDLNAIYDDYAKTVGIASTSMKVLNYILTIPDCTQRMICEMTFLPRQTVNSIVTDFYNQGYIELKETKKDRRVKSIHLTEKGIEYSDKIIPKLANAQYCAMKGLDDTEREVLIELLQKYTELFREHISE